MEIADIVYIIKWWLVFFVLGLIFLPLTTRIFSNFFDKGYIFSKIIGIALISYVVFLLGILKIAPFTELTIFIVILIFLILNILISKYSQRCTSEESFHNTLEVARQRPRLLRGGYWKIFLFEEVLFLATLFFWSYIRAHEPSIHGLEKYEDFGFINSIVRSEYFPPRDMWFTPFSINYYYFGHLVTAVLTKLSSIPSYITFNLMLATIFALTFTGAFSIGANLIEKVKNQPSSRAQVEGKSKVKSLLGGLLTGFLVTMGGNLHTVYTFFKPYVNENPVPFWQLVFSPNTFPNSYWYPNATRFIQNTIHEPPIYSFVVSDLHGHVLDMPFVLFAIAFLFALLPKLTKRNYLHFALLLGFILSVMYMTNTWDSIIYFLLAALVLLVVYMKQGQTSTMEIKNARLPARQEKLKIKNSFQIENFKSKILSWLFSLFIIAVTFVLFTLLFNLHFKPFVSGIGILCAPELLTNIGNLGPFLFEKDHCLRSPIWQLAILYGFFYFFVTAFVVSIFPKIRTVQNGRLTLVFKSLVKSDIFILLLIILSTLLIIIPEFIYIKDIYPGHYRANTMFKLVYQAFIMLSISSAYIIVRVMPLILSRLRNNMPNIFNFYFAFFIFSILFFILVMIYPYFAINSYYNLKMYQGLDGIKYLKQLYPTDYEGILWINKNIKGQPVILEAQGDSYTDYGRVSTNTGLPTVLGWTVHEWLWRGTYDIPAPRIPEVQKMYESEDLEETKSLLQKYNVELVFFGDLERQKYPSLKEDKFKSLGKVIYKNGKTKIYEILF